MMKTSQIQSLFRISSFEFVSTYVFGISALG